jgi:hypothetical protein
MDTTFAEQKKDEVYVFVRGRLVMKLWLLDGVDRVATFHIGPKGERYCADENFASESAW